MSIFGELLNLCWQVCANGAIQTEGAGTQATTGGAARQDWGSIVEIQDGIIAAARDQVSLQPSAVCSSRIGLPLEHARCVFWPELSDVPHGKEPCFSSRAMWGMFLVGACRLGSRHECCGQRVACHLHLARIAGRSFGSAEESECGG